MNNKNKIKLNLFISIIAFFVGAMGMYLVFYYFPIDGNATINKLEKEVTVTDAGIADAVEKVYDSVVVVESYKSGQLIGSGTGFVYKTDDKLGYILTNNHVVADADSVKVILTNEKEVETKLIGKDTYSDIAVLSIPKKDVISVAEIGKTSDLRVGDTVFAVGAPLDSAYSWTVTRGIISGKDRMVEVALSNSTSSDYIMKVLQTDTAINSGNSGGPLANSNGEVIGITSLKLISSGVEGMGFAIMIEDAISFAQQIEKTGVIERPYLGISMYDSSYTQFKNVSVEGVTIYSVEENSSAAKSGLMAGDVVISIGEEKVSSVAEFKYKLYKYPVGETIKIIVKRDGKDKTISVKLKSQTNA